MDDTVVFFEAKHKSTAHVVREDIVSIRCIKSNNGRVLVCVLVVCHGTKMPLFFIFKDQQNERLEKFAQHYSNYCCWLLSDQPLIGSEKQKI